MEALMETTAWETPTPNHVYLVDGNNLLAYIRQFEGLPYWFKGALTLDKRGRTFKKVDTRIFGVRPNPEAIEVRGSKGNVYHVTKSDGRYICTCTGFQFRGQCKHVEQVEESQQ